MTHTRRAELQAAIAELREQPSGANLSWSDAAWALMTRLEQVEVGDVFFQQAMPVRRRFREIMEEMILGETI